MKSSFSECLVSQSVLLFINCEILTRFQDFFQHLSLFKLLSHLIKVHFNYRSILYALSPRCFLMIFVHFIRICSKTATLFTHSSSMYSKYWSAKNIISSLVSRPFGPMPSFYIKIQTILIF